LGCRHCSMFVMLSLSFPSCPSCGEQSLQEWREVVGRRNVT
jgi:RNA polymerase subunit RPABC4/transcription elongation factor Spt4